MNNLVFVKGCFKLENSMYMEYYCFFKISNEIGFYNLEFCDTKTKLEFSHDLYSHLHNLESEKRPHMLNVSENDLNDLVKEISNQHCLLKHGRTLKEHETLKEIEKIIDSVVCDL